MSSRSPIAADVRAVVVMGVSGSGKSTVAARLAERLGWECVDGDAFHPPANIEKMKRGTPLTDDDRWPWLRAIAARIDEQRARHPGEGRGPITGIVVACSALKRAYRDILIGARGDVRLVYLKGDRDTVAQRLATRDGHFMPPALLESQFATLEEPQPGEQAIVASIDASPAFIVEAIVAKLRRARATGSSPRSA